jgi:hypothetical protein
VILKNFKNKLLVQPKVLYMVVGKNLEAYQKEELLKNIFLERVCLNILISN